MKKPKENTAQSKATTVPSTRPPLEAMEQKGDLLIHDLWNNETESVHDMHVVNKYANSHSAKTPEKCLHEAERAKKNMYLEYLPQQRQQFSFFVASIDGLLGVEATVTLKMISRRLKKSGCKPT